MSLKKIEYKSSRVFMTECAKLDVLPAIHWREDEFGVRGFTYFKVNKDEAHVFYSNNKQLLDAIWNSIGLIRHALKLADEVK